MKYLDINSQDKQQTQIITKSAHKFIKQDLQHKNTSNHHVKNTQIKYLDVCAVATPILAIIFAILFYFATYRVEEQYPFERYNQHLKGQIFGNFSQLYIKWNPSNMSKNPTQAGLPYYYNRIQVGSVLDFGLTEQINFTKVQQEMNKKLAYQLFYFQYNSSLQKEKQVIISQFSNDEEIQEYLDKLLQNSIYKQKSIQFSLGVQLIKNKEDRKVLSAEYYYANKKYNLDSMKQQKPICIYSSGVNLIGKKDRFAKHFDSIQNLNYTNFHIVHVDDYSDDQSFEQLYKQIKNSSRRIRNRIKFIHTFQRLGIVGNMNFWIRKYCNTNDIVVVLDTDDIFIGRQVLKIINSIYQSTNIWYLYSMFILTKDQIQYERGEASTFLSQKILQYRISFKWQTSHMRTFRKQLLDSVPLIPLLQYHYQKQLGVIWPGFYKQAGDMFLVHAQLQIAGNHRIAHIQDYLYLYYFQVHINKDCHREEQIHDGDKSKIKTPLKLVSKLGQRSKLVKNYKVGQNKLKQVETAYNSWIQCLKRFNQKKQKL